MTTLMSQTCWALVAQALLVDFNYVQRCQSIVTAAASGCGPVVSPMTGRRLGSLPREQQPRTSNHRADAGPCIIEC
jgi:hypothetical protein